MNAKKIPYCTDKELLDELKKLGYNDVSPDVLEIMKDDLSQLITKEQYPSKKSVSGNEKQSSVDGENIKYRYSQKQFHRATKNLPEPEKDLSPNVAFDREKNYSDALASNCEISKTPSFEKYKNTLKSYKSGSYRRHESLSVDNIEKLSTDILHDPCSKTEYSRDLHGVTNEQYQSKRMGTRNEKESHLVMKQSCAQTQIPRPQRNFSDSDKSPISEVSLDNKFSDVLSSSDDISRVSAFDKYKNTFLNYKRNNYAKRQEIALPESINKRDTLPESNENIPSETGYRLNKRDTQNINTETGYQIYKQEIALPEGINKREILPESNKNITTETGYLRYKRDTENITSETGYHMYKQDSKNVTSETGYQSSISSVSLDSNKMKRKVLRHRDGKPVITEEFLDIPSIFNSSYPETQTLDSSKSFSSDDLSWKSNSSTGSISAVSPDALITPRSTFSLASTRSLHSRLVKTRKKKNDPVAMYNYYKKFWNEFKPPGEKTHDKIRWAVRDKMLDYNL